MFDRLLTGYPNAQTELFYTNPFTFLVAVVLSARMTDKGVNKATASLFKEVDTPEAMVMLGEEGLKARICSVGLYRTKAKHIVALSRILLDQYEGKVPDRRDALESLPGVGRKSANVVLNVIFGQPTFPVDTHVFRVSRRTGLVSPSWGRTPLTVEKALQSAVPRKCRNLAHHLLVLHGRYVCKSRKPRCHTCSISSICLSRGETTEGGEE